jgi:hypothetical protein
VNHLPIWHILFTFNKIGLLDILSLIGAREMHCLSYALWLWTNRINVPQLASSMIAAIRHGRSLRLLHA